jgi:hypothetical protein
LPAACKARARRERNARRAVPSLTVRTIISLSSAVRAGGSTRRAGVEGTGSFSDRAKKRGGTQLPPLAMAAASAAPCVVDRLTWPKPAAVSAKPKASAGISAREVGIGQSEGSGWLKRKRTAHSPSKGASRLRAASFATATLVEWATASESEAQRLSRRVSSSSSQLRRRCLPPW